MIKDFLDDLNNQKWRFQDLTLKNGEKAFKTHLFRGDDRLLIIFGPNASGKSLISSALEQLAREEKVGVRNASMANRTSSSVERAMILGNESEQSTGATSFSFAKKCLDSTFSDNKPALAILDEPDIGLSQRYSRTLGQFVAQYANQFHEPDVETKAQGLVVVSHNKDLIESLIKHYKGQESVVNMGDERSLQQWLDEKDEPASIEELESLGDLELEKWRLVNRMFEDVKKEQNRSRHRDDYQP